MIRGSLAAVTAAMACTVLAGASSSSASVITVAGPAGQGQTVDVRPITGLLGVPIDPVNVDVTVSADRATLTVVDRLALVPLYPGCRMEPLLQRAVCTGNFAVGTVFGGLLPNTVKIRGTDIGFSGGAGNDVADMQTTNGNADLGTGDDHLDVRGGASNHVTCGPGRDTVLADPEGVDLIASDCEVVTHF